MSKSNLRSLPSIHSWHLNYSAIHFNCRVVNSCWLFAKPAANNINYCLLFFQPKPTKGKMRIHCLENVDKALSFLYEQRVHLENLGAQVANAQQLAQGDGGQRNASPSFFPETQALA